MWIENRWNAIECAALCCWVGSMWADSFFTQVFRSAPLCRGCGSLQWALRSTIGWNISECVALWCWVGFDVSWPDFFNHRFAFWALCVVHMGSLRSPEGAKTDGVQFGALWFNVHFFRFCSSVSWLWIPDCALRHANGWAQSSVLLCVLSWFEPTPLFTQVLFFHVLWEAEPDGTQSCDALCCWVVMWADSILFTQDFRYDPLCHGCGGAQSYGTHSRVLFCLVELVWCELTFSIKFSVLILFVDVGKGITHCDAHKREQNRECCSVFLVWWANSTLFSQFILDSLCRTREFVSYYTRCENRLIPIESVLCVVELGCFEPTPLFHSSFPLWCSTSPCVVVWIPLLCYEACKQMEHNQECCSMFLCWFDVNYPPFYRRFASWTLCVVNVDSFYATEGARTDWTQSRVRLLCCWVGFMPAEPTYHRFSFLLLCVMIVITFVVDPVATHITHLNFGFWSKYLNPFSPHFHPFSTHFIPFRPFSPHFWPIFISFSPHFDPFWPYLRPIFTLFSSSKNQRNGSTDFYFPKKIDTIKIGATVTPISIIQKKYAL